jgi:hypothetical protein
MKIRFLTSITYGFSIGMSPIPNRYQKAQSPHQYPIIQQKPTVVEAGLAKNPNTQNHPHIKTRPTAVVEISSSSYDKRTKRTF